MMSPISLYFRFDVVGYGCMTCIGNSGPLADPVADAIEKVLVELSMPPYNICMIIQGSYRSWKTWKVMEFDNLDSRPGKSWNFGPGPGKSWNFMLANLYAS